MRRRRWWRDEEMIIISHFNIYSLATQWIQLICSPIPPPAPELHSTNVSFPPLPLSVSLVHLHTVVLLLIILTYILLYCRLVLIPHRLPAAAPLLSTFFTHSPHLRAYLYLHVMSTCFILNFLHLCESAARITLSIRCALRRSVCITVLNARQRLLGWCAHI